MVIDMVVSAVVDDVDVVVLVVVVVGVVDEVDVGFLVVTVVSGMIVSMSGDVVVFIVVLSVGSGVRNENLKHCSGLNQIDMALEQGLSCLFLLLWTGLIV